MSTNKVLFATKLVVLIFLIPGGIPVAFGLIYKQKAVKKLEEESDDLLPDPERP